jgi:hypothetical protein
MSLETAVARMTEGLKEDPRHERVGGEEGPRDLLFTQRVVEWVGRLSPQPSEALLLAAWGHVLDRWKLPRDSHPKTTAGYHKWRRALDAISADATWEILREEGIGEDTGARVRDLILKKNFPTDPESQILEDADCLAFLELKLDSYLSEWDEAKTIRILKGTLEKMSPKAKELAGGISYSPEAKNLFQRL